jgi:hypothetical protein
MPLKTEGGGSTLSFYILLWIHYLKKKKLNSESIIKCERLNNASGYVKNNGYVGCFKK